MQPNRVLARLEHETQPRHAAADKDRLALLTSPLTVDAYRSFLSRVYGFESQVECAVFMTQGLEDVLDLREHRNMRLLKSDLCALGVSDLTTIPRCTTLFRSRFRSVAQALGWIYVLERSAMLHEVMRHHVKERLGARIANASSYFVGNHRAFGERMRGLSSALDKAAPTLVVADQIVDAAHSAFGCQRQWFAETRSPVEA